MSRHRTRREVFAASPAVAVAAMAGVSTLALAGTEEADAVLLDLGREWSARRQRLSRHQDLFDEAMKQPPGERHNTYQTMADIETALYGDVFDTESRIIATPAKTLAGLQLKARVVAREHDFSQGADLASIERLLDDPDVTEGRPGLSLAADILRLGRIA